MGDCVASGVGKDYQVGEGSGQYSSLDQVPWASLAAGDTVRIFYKSTPYYGKFLIAANGTAAAPVRICGVKSSTGQRPIIDGANAVAPKGLAYGLTVHEQRSLIVVKPLSTQAWEAYPTYVQIDGLELRGAKSSNTFTDSTGTKQSYVDFGACIWVDRGQNITIADNVIHDCNQGIFTKSTTDGEFAVSKNIRIAGNYIYENGVSGQMSMHNTYTESLNIVYEFNHIGPLRSGALGNAIKDRSAGTVIRFNRIEDGAHAIDLVEADASGTYMKAQAAYRTTYVYGNQIIKSGDTGSCIHYGGDLGTSAYFRKGTLYFFNNTVYLYGVNYAAMFQLSTTDERAEVWNNILAYDPSNPYPRLRATSDGVDMTAGGVLNLGKNWLPTNWMDSDPYHTVPGQLLGTANIISSASIPVDLTTLVPLSGTSVIDAAQSQLSAVSAYPVSYQLNTSYVAQTRSVNGSAMDLGAVEK